MPLPVPHFRPPPLPEPAPIVRVVERSEDVTWNRPIFKAPPLEVYPRLFNPAVLTHDLRQIGLGIR